MTLIMWLITCVKGYGQCPDKICIMSTLQLECKLYSLLSAHAVRSSKIIPFLNVEKNKCPDHIVRMHLYSNLILFCKHRFLCRGLGDITRVSAEQRQGYSHTLRAVLIVK